MSRHWTGKTGEEIAERFLLGKGYDILDRNYRKLHGEIDIIAKDSDQIVFVEVKTITRENIDDVAHETYRPEFNVDQMKIDTVSRTAKLYLSDSSYDVDWRMDLVSVEIEERSKKAKIRHLKNVYF